MNKHTFTISRDAIPVDSIHPARHPDPNWIYADSEGHIHRWYVDGHPAEGKYDSTKEYLLPTLKEVEEESYDEDYGSMSIYYMVCKECEEEVKPMYEEEKGTSGVRWYMPGLLHFLVDGVEVDAQEFFRLAVETREMTVEEADDIRRKLSDD